MYVCGVTLCVFTFMCGLRASHLDLTPYIQRFKYLKWPLAMYISIVQPRADQKTKSYQEPCQERPRAKEKLW